MKVIAVRPFMGAEGMVNSGSVIDVSDLRARELESARPQLAVPLVNKGLVAVRKEAASEGAPRPTQTAPIGGQTGEVKPVSLSPPDRAPQKRKYTKRKGKRG